MKLTPTRRWLILGSLLTITVAAGMLAEDEPAPRKNRPKAPASSAAAERGGKGEALASAATVESFREPAAPAAPPEKLDIDPFRGKNWYVAPPPPPPPKPTAPPLPFQYLGKVVEDGDAMVFLNHQGKHLIARVGDEIAGTYTVEEISGGRMTFLYQPLKERQILAIGTDK